MKILNLDWLTLYVDCSQDINGSLFVRKDLEFGTRQYRTISEYFINKERVATLCHNPCSSILKEGTGLLKIDNNVFYKSGYQKVIESLLQDLNLKILSISRFDLCLDFEIFDNGMQPQTLINQFITNEIWKIGTAKYRIIGHQNLQHIYDYLRFGSNTSDCSVYLYNKSLEMKEVKQKNYIMEQWKKANIGKNNDVWRLEISIKGNNIQTMGFKLDKLRNFTLKDVTDTVFNHEIYYQLINKYFEFRINDGQIRKDRMKKLELFKYEPTSYTIEIGKNHNTTSKSDKIFINKYEQVFDELRNNKKISQLETRKFLETYVNLCGLNDWYSKIYGVCIPSIKEHYCDYVSCKY